MKKRQCILAAFCCLVAFAGCNRSPSGSEQPQSTNGNSATDEHSHPHAVDHSIEGHAHGAGPHGGTIVDWGGGTFHVEFTVDHDKQQATAYVLGSDEKTPTPIDSEFIELAIKDPAIQFKLTAVPQERDPAGKSSRYEGTHEKLSTVQEYAGTLTAVVNGTPYSGDFTE